MSEGLTDGFSGAGVARLASRGSPGGASARSFLSELEASGGDAFGVEESRELAGRAGVGERYLPRLLGRLVEAGVLVRLKRGLYAVAHGSSWVYATRLVYPSAVSHYSALNYWSLSEQVPIGVYCTTPGGVVTPSMRASAGGKARDGSQDGAEGGRHRWELPGGVPCEYVVVRDRSFFGVVEVEHDYGLRVPIFDRERTVLDLFASPRHFPFGQAMEVIEGFAGELDLPRLAGYALRYGSGAVVSRLGWALEEVGVEDEAVTGALRQFPIRGARPLDPHRPRRGPVDGRWGVQLNLPGSPRPRRNPSDGVAMSRSPASG